MEHLFSRTVGKKANLHLERAGLARIDVLIDDAELSRRRAAWTPPPPRHTAGLLAKYAQCVGQADAGAVTHAGGVVWPEAPTSS